MSGTAPGLFLCILMREQPPPTHTHTHTHQGMQMRYPTQTWRKLVSSKYIPLGTAAGCGGKARQKIQIESYTKVQNRINDCKGANQT